MKRYFWKNFFPLLLVVIAIAEWTCVAWILSGFFSLAFPWPVHVAAPACIYLINRRVVRRAPPAAGVRRAARQVYTGFAFACVFGFLFLLVLLLVAFPIRLSAGTFGLLGSGSAFSSFVSVIGTAGLTVIGAAMLYGYSWGGRRLWVNEFDVAVKDLPPEFDGFRLLQISDVHLGVYMNAEAVRGYVERIRALAADFVVITGDITDGLAHAPETFPALGAIEAPHGVAAILGNHDVGTGADDVCEALERFTNFRVLNDETMTLERGSARLAVIGLRDRGLDWARGVASCDELDELAALVPERVPRILLSHRPDLFSQAAALDCVLVLSGHTHGGQLAIPWTRGRRATLARFMTRYPRGTYFERDSVLHVNLGLGMTGQPVRVATPREVTVITLRAAPNGGPQRPPATATATATAH